MYSTDHIKNSKNSRKSRSKKSRSRNSRSRKSRSRKSRSRKSRSRKSRSKNSRKSRSKQQFGGLFKKYLLKLPIGIPLIPLSKLYEKSYLKNKYMYDVDDNEINIGPNLIKNVDGIGSISRFMGNNKEIIMFGDIHLIGSICKQTPNTVSVPKIFDLIIKYNPNIEIDFFSEDANSSSLYGKFNYLIAKTKGNLYNPISLRKTRMLFRSFDIFGKYYWPNLRYHSIDIRQSDKNRKDYLLLGNKPDNFNKNKDYFRKLMNYDLMFEEFKINEQINNILDPNIKKVLIHFLEQKFKYIIDNPSTINNGLLKGLKIEGESFYKCKDLLSFYMDAYTLSCIFRPDSKFILIYAGIAHVDFYREFFSIVGLKEVFFEGINHTLFNQTKNQTSVKQCINVSKTNILKFYKNIAENIKDKKFFEERDIPFNENDFKKLNKLYYDYFK